MKRQLTPKQYIKRMQDHQLAVRVLARQRARKLVEAELRAEGRRVSLIPPREINELAQGYLAQHGDRLRAEAEQTIATSHLFVQWRKPDEPEFLTK